MTKIENSKMKIGAGGQRGKGTKSVEKKSKIKNQKAKFEKHFSYFVLRISHLVVEAVGFAGQAQ